jgi:hypothetical protein
MQVLSVPNASNKTRYENPTMARLPRMAPIPHSIKPTTRCAMKKWKTERWSGVRELKRLDRVGRGWVYTWANECPWS